MAEATTGAENPQALPSVDDVVPSDEGGPVARSGFTYQDEIAVGFLIEMLGNSALVKVHCETHDDALLVWSVPQSTLRLAEFVQVKASQPDKLWSVADLCTREKGKAGTSILEISLSRDKHRESSLFRLVTLRPVVSDLEMLTFPRGAPGREPDGERFKALQSAIDARLPDLTLVQNRKCGGSYFASPPAGKSVWEPAWSRKTAQRGRFWVRLGAGTLGGLDLLSWTADDERGRPHPGHLQSNIVFSMG